MMIERGFGPERRRFSRGGGAIKALVAGDSITAYAEVHLSLTGPSYATDNGDGTVTVYRTSHSACVGEPFRLISPQMSTNLLDGQIASVVDANSFTGTISGRTHGVTSPTAGSVIFPNRRSSKGWLTWLETLLGEVFDATWCAVGGASIADVTEVVAKSDATLHDIGFVCVGMNDVYSDGNSLATMKEDMQRLLSLVSSRSAYVCVLSVPPRNSADAAWSAGKQTIHTGFNRWLHEECRTRGYLFVNTARSVANGATYINSGATEPDPNSAHTSDNTHPSSVGAYAIAKSVRDAIADIPMIAGWSPAHVDDLSADAGMVITDGAFATDSGGVATGWAQSDTTTNSTVGNSCASRTVADDGDAFGRNQTITYRYGTATGTASTRFRKNNIHASVTAGSTIQMRVPFSVTGAAGLLGLELCMFGTKSDGTFWQVYGMNLDSNADPHTDAISGVLQTPRVVVPSDLSDLDVWVRPYINSSQSSDVTIKLWHAQLRQF